MAARPISTALIFLILTTTTTSTSSFDSNANYAPAKGRTLFIRNAMTTLAASTSSDDRGSGTSSWPSMQRPPANADSTDHGSAATATTTNAMMNYVSPETTEISTRRDLGGSDDALIGAIWNPTLVHVNNARNLMGSDNQMTLDGNGFELVTTDSDSEETKLFQRIDYCGQEDVVSNYYPTCERLVSDAIMSQTRSSSSSSSAKSSSNPIACVCAFDHNVRSSDRASVGKIKSTRHLNESDADGGEDATTEPAAAADPQVQNPAGLVHADYTKTSAPRRLEGLSNPPKLNDVLRPKLLAENRKSLLDPTMVQEALEGKRRYAFVNVWRSIDAENPVSNPPLACVDAKTASVDDLRTFKIHYVDRVGENYFVCPPPPSSLSLSSGRQPHSWYYYPEMTMEEALLLKQWDSMGGVARGARSDDESSSSSNGGAGADGAGLSTFTIHSAFIDPSCSAESPPRKSIEVRCVVIWEKES